MPDDIIKSAIVQFRLYKILGEKTFQQLNDEMLNHTDSDSVNSMSTIIKHLRGNMLSRWTDFLTTDGEKEWRSRDHEFENTAVSRDDLINLWNEGWECLFGTLESLTDQHLDKVVKIRGQELTVIEAIHRQLAHYSYHVGQIVMLGKLMLGENWKSLSIPKGQSKQFNAEMFDKGK